MRFTTLALAAVVATVPFAAANAQQAPQGYDQGPPPGYNQGQQGYQQTQDRHEMRHLLNREQRAMLKEQIRSQGGSHAAFHQQMQQMASMSPDQQTQMRNELQAQWNSLPAAQKQEIQQRIAERRQEHQQRRQSSEYGQQQYTPQQYGPQQPGPQQYAPQGQPPQNGDDE